MHQSRRLTAIRSIVIVLFLTSLAHAVYAQEVKMLRVGRVGFQSPAMLPVSAFLKRMEELGYIQGKNFVFESVQVSSLADYDHAYRELATRKLDIMLATGPEIALKSALAVAGPRPIVMIAVDYDPLARPVASFRTLRGLTATSRACSSDKSSLRRSVFNWCRTPFPARRP